MFLFDSPTLKNQGHYVLDHHFAQEKEKSRSPLHIAMTKGQQGKDWLQLNTILPGYQEVSAILQSLYLVVISCSGYTENKRMVEEGSCLHQLGLHNEIPQTG